MMKAKGNVTAKTMKRREARNVNSLNLVPCGKRTMPMFPATPATGLKARQHNTGNTAVLPIELRGQATRAPATPRWPVPKIT